MCNGAEINLTDGFGDTEFHERLIKQYNRYDPLVAKNGYQPDLFSGSRRGKDDETAGKIARRFKKTMPNCRKA